jgi:fatty-acyl-CoA synthase
MAAAKAGLVLVPVNPLLRGAEIEYILRQGDVRALFFMAQIRDHNCLETMRAMTTPGTKYGEVTSERLPRLRYLALVGAPPPALLDQPGWRPATFRQVIGGGQVVTAEALAERQASVKPSDPAMVLYTSGTTGFPKGAVLTHYNLTNEAMTVANRLNLDKKSRSCVLVPFFHVFGCVGYTLAQLYLGGTIHPVLAFDPLKAMQIISSERCQFTGGVPTMLLAMLQHPDFGKYDLSSLEGVVCAGAPVPVALMEQVKERIGADVVIAFGQTENTGAITLTLRDDPFELKAATVGIPLPYVDVKVIDPITGEVVPIASRGELCARGWLVMVGYYNMPERTAEAVDKDGWLHTGDLATMNAEGYINIVGRIKDIVIRGGENISPREIEEFLFRHPKVADVAVLGVPDAFFGEELLAVVMPRAGVELTEEELRDFCNGQISKQKIPRYFKLTDAFPMTASGKIQKFILREQAIKELGLEEVAAHRTA